MEHSLFGGFSVNNSFFLFCFQVLNFVQTFADLLPDYEVSCEHEHSNCVLIAHKKVSAQNTPSSCFDHGVLLLLLQFKIEGKWWTWIDYDKFHELVNGSLLSCIIIILVFTCSPHFSCVYTLSCQVSDHSLQFVCIFVAQQIPSIVQTTGLTNYISFFVFPSPYVLTSCSSLSSYSRCKFMSLLGARKVSLLWTTWLPLLIGQK